MQLCSGIFWNLDRESVLDGLWEVDHSVVSCWPLGNGSCSCVLVVLGGGSCSCISVTSGRWIVQLCPDTFWEVDHASLSS